MIVVFCSPTVEIGVAGLVDGGHGEGVIHLQRWLTNGGTLSSSKVFRCL